MDEQNIVTDVQENTATNIETDNSQVLNQATPMDSNTTYNNLPQEDVNLTNVDAIVEPEPHIDIDPNKDLMQNMIQNTIAIDSENNLQRNAGQSMNNFLNNEYDYDRNEAGTYWVAGAINDVDTQMSFLNTLINEEMYDEMDLQKYYYDTTMATARAYAAQKKKETAYGFYRAAQEKAIAEAALTGWYMPAEGNYMLGQYVVAQNKLEDQNTTPEERAKAERVTSTTEQWFAANQISTRGIKCLSMMQYEETVRHNTIMGELAKQANQIAAAGQAASAEAQMAELKFRVEEMELQSGHDYSKEIGLDNNDWIGHQKDSKYQMLNGAQTVQEVLKNPFYYEAILGYRGTEWMKQVLGSDYDKYNESYNATANMELLNSDEYSADKLNGQTFKLKNKTIRDGTEKLETTGNIKVVPMKNSSGKIEQRVFVEVTKGNWKQLSWDNMESHLQATNGTDKVTYGGLELENGDQLGKYVRKETFVPESKVTKGVRIYDKVYNDKGERVYLTNNTGKSDLEDTLGWNGATKNQKVVDSITEQREKGYVVVKGKYADDKGFGNNQKNGIVMYNAKEDKYISITTEAGIAGYIGGKGAGAVTEIKSTDLKSLPNKNWDELSQSQKYAVLNQATYVGDIKDKVDSLSREYDYHIYAYKDGEGTTHYVGFTDRDGIWDGEDTMALDKDLFVHSYTEKDLKSLKNEIKMYEKRQDEYKSNQTSNPKTNKTKDFSSEKTSLNLGNLGGSTKSSSGTENTFSSKDPNYQAYVLRMQSEQPNAEMLTQSEWEKKKQGINDVSSM